MSSDPIDLIKEIYNSREDLGVVVEKLRAAEDSNANTNIATQKCAKYSKYSFKGDSPLHVAMKHGKHHLADLVQLLVKMYPNACRETNNEGELPIHRLHAKNGSAEDSDQIFESIKLLLKVYPEALHIVCSRERLPFSYIKTSSKLTKYLIENHPQWVKTEDGLGNLPVHWACRGGNLEAVKMCVNAYPAGLEHKNDDDRLPLHYAVATSDDPKIVEIVAEKYPEAVKMPDSNTGLLPIACAKSVGTVSALAKACPEVFDVACSCPSQDGVDVVQSVDFLRNHPIVQYLEESKFDKSGSDRVQVMLKYCNASKIRKLEEQLHKHIESEAMTNKNNGARIKQLEYHLEQQIKKERVAKGIFKTTIKELEASLEANAKVKEEYNSRIEGLENLLRLDAKTKEVGTLRIKELEERLDMEAMAHKSVLRELEMQVQANERNAARIKDLEEDLHSEKKSTENERARIKEFEEKTEKQTKIKERDTTRIKKLEVQLEMEVNARGSESSRMIEFEEQAKKQAISMERDRVRIEELEARLEMEVNARGSEISRMKDSEEQAEIQALTIERDRVRIEELKARLEMEVNARGNGIVHYVVVENRCEKEKTKVERYRARIKELEAQIEVEVNMNKIGNAQIKELESQLESQLEKEGSMKKNGIESMKEVEIQLESEKSRVKELEHALVSQSDALEKEIRSHHNTQQMLASLQNILEAKISQEDLLTEILESHGSEGLTIDNLRDVMSSLCSRLDVLRSRLKVARKVSTAQRLAKYLLSATDDDLHREDILDAVFDINKEVLELEQMYHSSSCAETEASTVTTSTGSISTHNLLKDTAPFERKSSPSSVVQVPFFLRNREEGHATHDPVSGMYPVLSSDDKALSPSLYLFEPRNTIKSTLTNSEVLKDRQTFYQDLSQLLGKEVAIKKYEEKSGISTYLTSHGLEKSIAARKTRRAIYKEEREYFILERCCTGGFLFKTTKKKGTKPLYLSYSSQSSDEVNDVESAGVEIVLTTELPLQFSDKLTMACEWIVDPNLGLESPLRSDDEGRLSGNILFLGIVGGGSKEIEMSWHASNTASAWNRRCDWEDAYGSLVDFATHKDGIVTDIDDKRTNHKWFLSHCTDSERAYVVITTSNFHQVIAEACMKEMKAMVVLTMEKLRSLAGDIQNQEDETTMEEDRLPTDGQVDEWEIEQRGPKRDFCRGLGTVPISMLHRDGRWLSVSDTLKSKKAKSSELKPQHLSIIPTTDNERLGISPMTLEKIGTENIKTREEYFDQLIKLSKSKIAIKNLETGRYLSCGTGTCRKRPPLIYSDSIGICEKFVMEYSPDTGGFSFKAHNNFFLTKRKNGMSAFKGNKTKEETEWLVIPNLIHSISGGNQILFVGVIKQDKSVVFSRHAWNSPMAWRTNNDWECMVSQIAQGLDNGTSTVFQDFETGHKWFATRPETGDDTFIVIATSNFSNHFGVKCVMAVEALQTSQNFKNLEEKTVLETVTEIMKQTQDEYMASELNSMTADVNNLEERMNTNLLCLQKNVEKSADLVIMSVELEQDTKSLQKLFQEVPYRAQNIEAVTSNGLMAVGGVVTGWLIGGPSAPLFLPPEALEILAGIAPRLGSDLAGTSINASIFWKRSFTSFGKCLNAKGKHRWAQKIAVCDSSK